MNKKKSTYSTNILSAFIILLCAFMSLIAPANSWFTHKVDKGVEITIRVGDLKLSLYHTSIDANKTNLIYTNNENTTSTTKKYIPLNAEVKANAKVPLTLIVSNEADDSIPMYVRFKFELYARGISEDTHIATTLSGFDAPSSTASGWAENGDGYYYYEALDGTMALLEREKTSTLFTHFEVDVSEFYPSETNKLINSDELYIVFTIDGSINTNFTQQ